MSNSIFSTIDLNATEIIGNKLIDQFSDARESEPIIWSEPSQAWMVLRHADVVDGFQGRQPLSAVRFTPEMVEPILGGPWQEHIPMIGRYVKTWITNIDGQNHIRLRKLIGRSFSRPVVESVRPYVNGRVKELFDRLDGQGFQAELVEEFGRELTGRVILKLMGMDESYFGRLKHWANAITTALGSGVPTKEGLMIAEEVLTDMTEVFTGIVADRRSNPREGDDFIGLLIDANEDGETLSEDEMIGLLQLAVFAGHDTTLNSIVMGTVGLSENPEQWDYFYKHPESTDNALLELMRVTAMSTAQNRTALEDFEWHGKQIRKGDTVFLIVASGNRDPRVFDDPEVMDMKRRVNQSLVFGPGLHFCLGHLLARMQLEEVFTAMTHRYSKVEILDNELKFNPPLLFRGLDHLNLRFTPRTAA